MSINATIRVNIYIYKYLSPRTTDMLSQIEEKFELPHFQPWIHMYPYYTETTSIMGIKQIAIYTS